LTVISEEKNKLIENLAQQKEIVLKKDEEI